MHKEKNGLFIVFEGIDGSGKTTLINMLFEKLKNKYNVLKTHEPYNISYIDMLKDEVNIYNSKVASIFMEDRKHHLKDVILPHLSKGGIVLCDRYKYSTMAYNSII